MVHALTILAAVMALAPLLGYLPMTSLAALLLLVAWNMSEVKHFVHTLRVAPKSDVAVLLTCYTLTVGFDMVIGVSVGMVLASLLFMRRMAEVTEARLTNGNHPAVPGPIPVGVAVYDISGPLFFGAAQKAMAALEIVAGETKAVVLLMDEVHAMDVTGLVALESALEPLQKHQCLAILSGVRSQPMALLKKGQLDRREGVILSPNPTEALAVAARHVSGQPLLVQEVVADGAEDGVMLVPCSHCGREVSEAAPACPACGRALAAAPRVPADWPPTPVQKKAGLSTSTGCAIVGIVILLVLMMTCALLVRV